MSFDTTGNRISYNGDDVTTAFPFPYLFYDSSHLKVILVSALGVETVQTIITHYTVAGVGASAGGTVTMLTPPATGEKLVILRVVPYNQGLLLVENDPFPSQSVMERLDLNVMMAQQLAGDIGRSMTVSEAEDSIGSIPTVAERAGKYAAYDSLGNPIASTGAAGTIAVSTFMEAALGATSAATLITAAELDDEPAWVTLAMMAGGTAGNLITYDANGDPAYVATGTAGQVLKSNGAGAAPTMQDNDAADVPYDNSTSGLAATDVQAAIDEVALGGTLHGPTVQTATGTETELDFTIPAWAKRIKVMFGGLSRNAETATLVRLGGAGGVKTSGYSAGFSRLQNASQSAADITVGFAVGSTIDSAGAVFRGKIVIDLMDTDTWCADGLIIQTDTMFNMTGTVNLGEQLTTVRITTVSGTATLTGTVSVKYE